MTVFIANPNFKKDQELLKGEIFKRRSFTF